MSITGGVKLFNRNQAFGVDGSTIVASTGNGASDLALDRNPNTYWRSVGSNDVTVETLTITFPTTVTFNRILLMDHNWKQFTVKYDVASVWTNFTNVVGLDGALGSISETVFADDTAYYEAASVSTTKIQITVTKTQIANAEKYISQIVVTDELGTLMGYPKIEGLAIQRTEKVTKTISGKIISQKSSKTFKTSLNFSTYPVTSTYTPDLDLMATLFDRDTNFIIWLCGGRRGTNYFKYTTPGFRLKDIFEVQTVGDFSPSYLDNVYINPVNLVMQFQEAV